MANGNTSPSRLGQINLAGATDALWLKVFSGEILTTFDRMTVMKDIVRMRTIKNGKSAQFPALGKATAKYHVIGENILDAGNTYLNTIAAAEKVISIDSTLLAPVVVSNWEEMVNHYDVRSDYATELGRALAQKFDKQNLQLVTLCARAAATITGNPRPAAITDANIATTAAALLTALSLAAQEFDESDVPEEDRHAVISPKMYWLLVNDKTLINRDFNGDGRNGVFFDGKVYRAAGMQLHKSNNIPSTVVAAATGENNTYSGDFTKTKGVCFHKSATGTVKLLDLAFEKEYRMELQGTLMIAKYAMGHGILRPECAIELALP